jgi:signal peptidase I
MNKKVLKELLSWVIIVVVAFALAFLINRFVILKISSPTPSMENTFLVGERVLTYRLAYVFSDPKRGDIVVFRNPDDESET